ncbi:hypothetical protein [Sphingomonas sp. DT-204]|uniref:hypothetical protein n=1 Tax=Sphingomonas sp. DT-204 TaxID=3396166 RepID=UPI003F1AF4E5
MMWVSASNSIIAMRIIAGATVLIALASLGAAAAMHRQAHVARASAVATAELQKQQMEEVFAGL